MCPVTSPPFSLVEPVVDVLHGVPITDPYRWLEDQNSLRTRAWVEEQMRHARTYLDAIPGREKIRERIREFLDVETYDSFLVCGSRYFFRKRLPGEEQPAIYLRDGAEGSDRRLVDPAERGTGCYTSVKPLRISPNGNLLLYEVKQGGERTGIFEIFDVECGEKLSDGLPHGYLRGFEFAPDSQSFYFVHEPGTRNAPLHRAGYQHVLGSPSSEDRQVFTAGSDPNVRLSLASSGRELVFYVYHLFEKTLMDVYVKSFAHEAQIRKIFSGIAYGLDLRFVGDMLLALTDRAAPNRRIVQIRLNDSGEHGWIEIVPETAMRIESWLVGGESIVVSYREHTTHRLSVFDLCGRTRVQLSVPGNETVRPIRGSLEGEEFLAEVESFTEPSSVFRYSIANSERTVFAKKTARFAGSQYACLQVSYASKDGTQIPMFVVGRREVLNKQRCPTIMTSYGGYGVPMTPQFSVFVAFLLEYGCLFALPNIRGGGEFGSVWRDAARRRNRQTAYDDFISAAEWLVQTGWSDHRKTAIFGGSNSGLLVGAALTQRPDLFRAVVCMVPILDMLRYHLFDDACVWKAEFGTADDPDDCRVLAHYSPYQNVHDGTAYPAILIVSGDADQNCNPLHARKMTARLQAANASKNPVLLDYSPHRGHSPVLPLNHRIAALTDRMVFLCDQLQLGI